MFPPRPHTVREPLQLTPAQTEVLNRYNEELQCDIANLSPETIAFFEEGPGSKPAETVKPALETVVHTRLQAAAILDSIAKAEALEERRA